MCAFATLISWGLYAIGQVNRGTEMYDLIKK